MNKRKKKEESWEKELEKNLELYADKDGTCPICGVKPTKLRKYIDNQLSHQLAEIREKINKIKTTYTVPDYRNEGGFVRQIDMNNKLIFEKIINRILQILEEK